jgi:multidrug resistance efflux pump
MLMWNRQSLRRVGSWSALRSVAFVLAGAAVLWWGVWSPVRGENAVVASPQSATAGESAHAVALASPARVEGASEAVELGAGLDGVIAELRVAEGDRVQKGETLAVIDRRELVADLRAARALLEGTRQARARLLRGSRVEERARADAEVASARAAMLEAELRHRRNVGLLAAGAIAAADRDATQRDLDMAHAQLEAALQRADLVKAPPLPEDVARADAEIGAAQGRVHSIEQLLDKTQIRAPFAGTILRTLLKPGESFSTLVPRPILVLADTSHLRVRAEVDERDVRRVFLGQRVVIRAEGWESPDATGRVTRLAVQMGRKNTRTGDPADKSDRDVLEVLVDMDRPDPRMVVGMRVTAVFHE